MDPSSFVSRTDCRLYILYVLYVL